MYDILTTRELIVLQNKLFDGTEDAFSIASGNGLQQDTTECHRVIHEELAHLFMEAATELIGRFENIPKAA